MNRLILFFALMATNILAMAQTSDSLIVNELRKDGVRFSSNNTVVLLKSGQEKFDDMFEAIRHAKSSVHLEYFNFRNDSIARCLFEILEEKAKAGFWAVANDKEKIYSLFDKIYADAKLRKVMGENGYDFFCKNLTTDKVYAEMIKQMTE
jgi:phosphatidylserine/phosphatidylglycerophosphate/cardiolipin synthase-like enzyme